MKMTLPARDGISVAGLKEMLPPKREKPNGMSTIDDELRDQARSTDASEAQLMRIMLAEVVNLWLCCLLPPFTG